MAEDFVSGGTPGAPDDRGAARRPDARVVTCVTCVESRPDAHSQPAPEALLERGPLVRLPIVAMTGCARVAKIS